MFSDSPQKTNSGKDAVFGARKIMWSDCILCKYSSKKSPSFTFKYCLYNTNIKNGRDSKNKLRELLCLSVYADCSTRSCAAHASSLALLMLAHSRLSRQFTHAVSSQLAFLPARPHLRTTSLLAAHIPQLISAIQARNSIFEMLA